MTNQMLANNPYAQYQQTQVETASPERLLLMLYDGAIRFANVAKKAIEDKDYHTASTHCIKVQSILNELMITLDMKVGGEIAQNLFDLYDFMTRETVEANISKNARRLEGVIEIFKELREAWMQAAKNVGALKTSQAIA